MARFTPSLHPRGKDGKFVKKGVGGGAVSKRKKSSSSSGPSRKDKAVKNFKRARAAYQVYGDITDVAEHGAKAYAYGVTGNYVKSALHGTKAGTASARLGSRASGAIVKRSKSIAPAKKRQFYAAQAKFDDRVQSLDNVATVGLFITGGSLRKPVKKGFSGGKKGAAGAYRARKDLRPAKQTRAGVYQITKVKKTTSGARVRR